MSASVEGLGRADASDDPTDGSGADEWPERRGSQRRGSTSGPVSARCNVVPPFDSVQLVHIGLVSLRLMVDISNITGAPPCRDQD